MKLPSTRESPENSQATSDVLCHFLQQQATQEVDMEVFDDDLLNFMYFV